MVRLWLFLYFGFVLNPAKAAIKTWKFTNDILDPVNWEGEEPAKGCNGVIFPDSLGSVGSVSTLFTDNLVLPKNGELEIREGGFIQFTETDICIRIKRLQRHHWFGPDSWKHEDNVAIPDVEKVPCHHDNVVFPSNATVAVVYPEISTYVNSITIGGVSVSNEQWQAFIQTDYGGEQFLYVQDYQTEISITSRECMSKSGCTCHFSDEELYWVCEYKTNREKAPCLDPIMPIGHCDDICGGVIFLDVSGDFELDKFQKTIPKQERINSYASKVLKNGKPVVQVVFVEKEEYSERSSSAASDFHGEITNDLKGFRVNSAILQISGVYISEGSYVGTAFGIIFGTLIASLCVFTVVYVIYMGPLENYSWGVRIPFGELSLRNLRPFLFAKFENKEEGQMSMAPSMMSLEKAFDNPMFGTQRPSTSSVGMEVVVMTETKPSTSEMTHATPAYGEIKHETVEIEDVEDTEE